MKSQPLNIFIADDDQDDVELLREALKEVLPLAQTTDVADGIAALRHIKISPPPDLVFLDLNMPLKNGLNCLKDIYNLELLPDTPVIIYSTLSNIKDIDEAYKHAAAFYIIKPSSYKQLSKIIKTVVTFLLSASNERVSKTDFVLSETKSISSSF